MNKEDPGGANLESVMYRLMEYDTKEGADKTDTMIMVSLVNLLGIISVMNKQAPFAPGSMPAAEDPLLPTLLGMLAQGPQNQRGGGTPGINPALLMSLLGSRGQRPENALVLALLSSLMQPPGPPSQQTPAEERERQGGHFRSGSEKHPGNNVKEAGKQGRQLSWDMRLG